MQCPSKLWTKELQCHFDQICRKFLLVKSWLLLFTFQIFGMKDYGRRFEYQQSTHW